ncbi:maternal embryonic leucine zipper kinase-like [Lycorma delicatula]|uniref:maternal embryonic leucine zipper kinase-like n=1 Tax=Lycorma delicatula TaxID=130591 RepID=UPI003F517432
MGRYIALKNLYVIGKTIGSGGFAKVKLATHILTGEKVAIKIMDKSSLGDDLPRVKLELEALKALSHHHISKLYQVIETSDHFFMVMEYCAGGELFDHIVEKTKLSEMESRSFFRQILSAVAYLHSVGYAHRDLKPENVLLDKDQSLKLIDFGLCAKPNGGLQTLLLTSCGSPTYAAPELIQGNAYFGSEVDVWSLGVILYALLCGFLPFDADNIDTLYKKILSGKYEEPPWLSKGSRQLLHQMLQTDKSERIKIEELLDHPWIKLGYDEPVDFQPMYKMDEYDEICVKVMAAYYRLIPTEMWNRISKWKYDYCTATYMILLTRKKQGLSVRLVTKLPQFSKRNLEQLSDIENTYAEKVIPGKTEVQNTFNQSPSLIHKREVCMMKKEPNSRLTVLEEREDITNSVNSRRSVHTPKRKPMKRHRSPEYDDVISPVPAKVTVSSSVKLNGLNSSAKKRRNDSESVKTPVTTPSRYLGSPGSKLLGSIEKSFNKVRKVLTPTKRRCSDKSNSINENKPNVLTGKNLCNISTTSYSCPEFVLDKLKKALDSKGIICQTKGYTIRGKLEGGEKYEKRCKLSFELEVCLVPSPAGNTTNSPALVVVQRKRLKGDAWCYKKICEEILSLTENRNHFEQMI